MREREEVSSTNMQIRDVKEILSFACLSCGQYNTGIWERERERESPPIVQKSEILKKMGVPIKEPTTKTHILILETYIITIDIFTSL